MDLFSSGTPVDPNAIFREYDRMKKEEAEMNEKKAKEEAEKLEKEDLYSQLPPHCLAYMPPKDPNPPPKRDPIPTRVLEPEECFDTCPRIIPRAEWNARMPFVQLEQMMFRVRPAVFKETDCANCSDLNDCKRVVKLLQMFQMDYMRFDDIAYSFLIGDDGTIYEGRGWGQANENARGICAIGYMGYHTMDDKTAEPSITVLRATYDLIMCGVKKGFLANPFVTGAFQGDSPAELVRDMIQQDEDIEYRSKPEDFGLYYDENK